MPGSPTTRRDILRWALGTAGVFALGPLGRDLLTEARGAPTGDPFLAVVNLFGGNDGLNTVIPISQSAYYDRRGYGTANSIAIPPGSERSLNIGPNATPDYGLHPVFEKLQGLWADGDVALVTRVGYPNANLSHFESQDIYSRGVRGDFHDLGIAESGWVARFADVYAPSALGAVGLGVGRPLDFEGGTTNSLLAQNLGSFLYESDAAFPDGHLHRLEAVEDVLGATARSGLEGEVTEAMQQGLDLVDQIQDAVSSYTSSVDYGGTNPPDIQARLRDVAMLVQYGFGTRLYYTGFGGFDTHSNQGTETGTQATRLGRLDTAIGAFADDMKAMGVWNDAVLVVISEFGRRNFVNASRGTDHGHGSISIVTGGAVNGGLYGPGFTESDLLLDYPAYEVDFRDVYREILADHLGVDASPVFPEPQPKNTTLGIV